MTGGAPAYPIDIDGDTYEPVPESWLRAKPTYDESGSVDAVRLYATSAAVTRTGRAVRVRYAHPKHDGVLTLYAPAVAGEGRLVPAGLAEWTGWPRSITPGPDEEPDGVIRQPEREHFLALWRDRIRDLEGNARIAIADGGFLQRGSTAVRTGPATPPQCRLSCPDGQCSRRPHRR